VAATSLGACRHGPHCGGRGEVPQPDICARAGVRARPRPPRQCRASTTYTRGGVGPGTCGYVAASSRGRAVHGRGLQWADRLPLAATQLRLRRALRHDLCHWQPRRGSPRWTNASCRADRPGGPGQTDGSVPSAALRRPADAKGRSAPCSSGWARSGWSRDGVAKMVHRGWNGQRDRAAPRARRDTRANPESVPVRGGRAGHGSAGRPAVVAGRRPPPSTRRQG